VKAIILSGGAGTRLRAISGSRPKPMMPLLGKPLLEHIVVLLRQNGFTQLCLTLHHQPEQIRQYFGDGRAFGVHIEYRQEAVPLGTAGAVKNCADFVADDPVLVMSGDCACDFDLGRLMALHREGVTIALSTNREPLAYGLVVTTPQGHITGFLEKPTWERVVTDRVSTGIYVLSPDILAHIPQGQPWDFAKDLFPRLLDRGIPMTGQVMEGYWCDIGTPRAYYQCNLDALDGRYHLPDGTDQPRCVFPCRDRARLMGAISQTLAEYGADFSDGLTIQDDLGRAHLAPLADRSALAIEGDTAAVHRLEALARRLEQQENP
jgi:mannose-1-phosphate guanylyltransferase/phosphomannomutase